MIDLHSHVLFDIDDGAQSIADSLKILARAEKIGITKMMATPHFSIGDDVEEFVKARDKRLFKLKEAMEHEGINISLQGGAEVYITDEIFNEEELKRLTLGESEVILAEFKYHSLKPETFIEYIDEILSSGLKVLVAHPERYSYLISNPMLLDALILRGVMFQINAISLFEDSPTGDFARMMVKRNLATVIGSDIHHPSSRRFDAMGQLGRSDDEGIQAMLNHNPDLIFKNSEELK